MSFTQLFFSTQYYALKCIFDSLFLLQNPTKPTNEMDSLGYCKYAGFKTQES